METYTGKECKHFYEDFVKCRRECQTDENWFIITFNPKKIDELISFLTERNYEFLENVSKYTKETNSQWDGLHNDYLFRYIHQ
jgi:hypothetical protein